MRHIAALLGRLLVALGALYGALLLLSLALRPREPADRPLDTRKAPASLWATEPKYVFLGRGRLATAQDKMLVVGASNAMAGLKQGELQLLLPHTPVHNLAIGGSNVTQVAQTVELVREVQTPAERRHNLFVVGLWYGLFASDVVRWHRPGRTPGDTDIDIERYRYGFYRRGEQGPVALLPPNLIDVGVAAIHPNLVLDELARRATATLRRRLSGKPAGLSDEERNARHISAAEQREYLAFWRRYMGSVSLGEEQFSRLRRCVEQLSDDGARVLLVDLPIPSWHARGAPLATEYRERLLAMLPSLVALPGVSALDMSDAAADDDFSDEVHPKPRVSARWAARVAEAMLAHAAVARTDLP
jgi:hypothetical protein